MYYIIIRNIPVIYMITYNVELLIIIIIINELLLLLLSLLWWLYCLTFLFKWNIKIKIILNVYYFSISEWTGNMFSYLLTKSKLTN